MTIRFLHTADLQIGKPFGQFPSEIAATLRAARFDILKRVALLGRDRGVDAVLVAGDCFDDIAVSDDTLRRFKIALEPFGGVWILLPGNHDPAIAESPWTRLRRFSLPCNVVIADEPQPVPIGNKAVILPAPLRRRRDAADLTEWFDTAVTEDSLVRVGVAHGSVREFLPEGSEAPNPIAPDRAERARLDYLALGDWHGHRRISSRTWYSGTPEPDRFRSSRARLCARGRYRWPGSLALGRAHTGRSIPLAAILGPDFPRRFRRDLSGLGGGRRSPPLSSSSISRAQLILLRMPLWTRRSVICGHGCFTWKRTKPR
jgi:DNA repair exonuclease SbcCD nuclease subunit